MAITAIAEEAATMAEDITNRVTGITAAITSPDTAIHDITTKSLDTLDTGGVITEDHSAKDMEI